MTRPSSPPPILSELRNPSSLANQVAALRALKNDIIGHEQKKQMWVGLGAVAPIARILNTHKGNGKRKYKEVNGGGNLGGRRTVRSEEEEARLQAVIVVGSLAQGGPAYLHPLTAGVVFPPLFAILNPADSHPQLVLAALRALNSVADSSLLEQPHTDSVDDSFLHLLYSDQHLTSLVAILAQTSPALIVQQQVSLAAALITKTCREESQRTLLAQIGILEALSHKLASFIVATGCSASALDSLPGCSIAPATNRSKLAPILQAIGTIISKSKQRTKQFISSPAFGEVFPGAESSRDTSTPSRAPYSGFHIHQHTANGHFSSLSSSPHRDAPTQTLGFPPLGGLDTGRGNTRGGRSFAAPLDSVPTEHSYGKESNELPLMTWLVHVVGAESAVTRIMASWVLTILYRMGLVNHRREARLAAILIPLLVRMLDGDYKINQDAPSSYDESVLHSAELLIVQQAPAVLSMLVEDNFKLQQAAVDAGAIKKLSQLLKQSYDPLPASSNSSLWSPNSSEMEDSTSQSVNGGSLRLGETGFSRKAYHVIRMRESVLIALAAMATAKDDYRKSIIDNGVVPFVIESLKPYRKISPDAAVAGGNISGNPTPVLLAACGTARALSRSVNTLRTSLIDAGLAGPLFVLLRHPDIEVQVAATAVVCNLLLEFSPMRETMIEAGVLQILCEHAHSMNARLRLNAVWGLKHLVHTAPNSLKMNCVEELGAGWLKQIISNDAEDVGYFTAHRSDREAGSGVAMGMGTPNAAGEQVDLLNAVEEESTGSAVGADEDDEDEVNMIDSIGALSKPENRASNQHLSGHLDSRATAGIEHRSRLTGAIDLEIQERLQARKDDIAVQEQALNLIQNLICGPAASEMVDFVFRELGQDKFFDILATRLLPKVPDLFRRDRRSSENNLRHVPPPPEIVKAVCYIVVHIAASSPKHRQLLMSQHELLSLIVPLFGHANKEIRAACAWLVINLTWIDDHQDRGPCKIRAHELRKLGIYEKLEEMESDSELDVRERTKTALHQMSELLRGVN